MSASERSSHRPRLVLLGINYPPEVTGIAPYNAMLAEWLVEHGWEVEVVTSFSYYPAWEKLPEDAGKLYRRDAMNGVTVHRVWDYVPKTVTALKRVVHEASFVVAATLRLFTLRKADVLFVVSPPLPLGVPAALYRFLRGVPTVFHVQDLQPDAAFGLGMLRTGPLTKLLYRLEAFAYGKATRVSGISPGMMTALHRKGVPRAKTLFFPNPVEFPDSAQIPPGGEFRKAHGIPSDAFLVSYSGNLGIKQGLGQIIKAAALLRHESMVRFVICGDGVMRRTLEEAISEQGLTNVTVLPLQPLPDYHALLIDSNFCLVTQQANSGVAFFPSKLLSIMAFARPVLAVADDASAVATLCREEGCGWLVAPDDAAAFAKEILRGKDDCDGLKLMAARGYAFVARFQRRKVLSRIEGELRSLLSERSH
ncbi:MAG: colanic acid biosynthesis glycosyltransferase WcaI [Puniceicoccaceae bacterium]|nr:MAG: colanic acid biosynthesis glycosyltransferase WcaI [Puniceicoccaceae bacterium]